MCKLVTVNCLSRYSGCKCILTFTNKSIAISQAYPHLMWFNKGSEGQTYHTWDINDQLNVSFHWFHIFAMILKSWDDVKTERVVFIFWCVL